MAETTMTLDQAMAAAVDHQKAGRLAEAEALYGAVLKVRPAHPVANHNMAVVALRVGRPDAAEPFARQAIASNPNIGAFHNTLGEVYRALARHDEALAAYNQAIALNPAEAFAHNNRGIVLGALGDVVGAEAAFRRAVDLQPRYPDALANLAHTLTKTDRHAEAERLFRSALELQPGHVEARLGLARCLLALRRPNDGWAELAALRGHEHLPGFPLLRTATLYAEAGHATEAEALLREALARDPADAIGAGPMLSILTSADPPARAADAQMARLYAGKAAGWDNGASGYRAAVLVADALRPALPASVLDLGCGTGLVAEALKPGVERLVGVDLSEAMLAKAAEKRIYDELHQGEFVAFLNQSGETFDAIACAATLIHFGDLARPFAAMAGRLKPGGLVAMTLFPLDDPSSFAVHPKAGLAQNGVFAHGRGYIAEVAQACGLEVVEIRDEVHERFEGSETMGLLVLLHRGQGLVGEIC